MANPMHSQNAAQKNAQHYFKKAEQQPDALAKQTRKKERAASAMNTARLRELRLAKEATDKEVADTLAAENPAAVAAPRHKRAPATKMVRMTY
jgi:hypothetical protein